MAVVLEAAGWSPLGPLALNIQAPDEGNINLLNQKERWLETLVCGEIRTVFSMTEPDGGAGSHPMLMKTTARYGSTRTIGRSTHIRGDQSWFVLIRGI